MSNAWLAQLLFFFLPSCMADTYLQAAPLLDVVSAGLLPATSLNAGEGAVWKGELEAAVSASGVRVSAPGLHEFTAKIFLSGDGVNFETAVDWTPAGAPGAASHFFGFGKPVLVKSLIVGLKGARPRAQLRDVKVDVLAGSFPLILAASFPGDAQCLTHTAGANKAAGKPCLAAFARGLGEELWVLSQTGQLQSSAGRCLVAGSSDRLTTDDCEAAAAAAPSLSTWAVEGDQIVLKSTGDCLALGSGNLGLQPCDASPSLQALPVTRSTGSNAAAVVDLAALLRAAATRQQVLKETLRATVAKAGTCATGLEKQLFEYAHASHLQQAAHAPKVQSPKLAETLLADLGLDLQQVLQLILDSRAFVAQLK